ncbi:hypothetical protein TSUD_82310 [Trifolium subterraneum]|uniref:Transmembrane protein n=1 Tax=Trifolium subterraneum TaxID=3900 RepID=A0A2Z6P8A4_TRISU|nr:hypothetical protein TSUD_82310 [Trifolium subterraneum]
MIALRTTVFQISVVVSDRFFFLCGAFCFTFFRFPLGCIVGSCHHLISPAPGRIFPASFVTGRGPFFRFYLRVVVLSSALFVSTVLVTVLVLLVADASSLVVLVIVGVKMGVAVAAVGFGVVLWY